MRGGHTFLCIYSETLPSQTVGERAIGVHVYIYTIYARTVWGAAAGYFPKQTDKLIFMSALPAGHQHLPRGLRQWSVFPWFFWKGLKKVPESAWVLFTFLSSIMYPDIYTYVCPDMTYTADSAIKTHYLLSTVPQPIQKQQQKAIHW